MMKPKTAALGAFCALLVSVKAARVRLPNVLAEDLLGKAGHVLRDTDTDMAYRMILDSMTANSIHEVNRVLRDMRMEPLTGPKTA